MSNHLSRAYTVSTERNRFPKNKSEKSEKKKATRDIKKKEKATQINIFFTCLVPPSVLTSVQKGKITINFFLKKQKGEKKSRAIYFLYPRLYLKLQYTSVSPPIFKVAINFCIPAYIHSCTINIGNGRGFSVLLMCC
jgi:hypothetical protein